MQSTLRLKDKITTLSGQKSFNINFPLFSYYLKNIEVGEEQTPIDKKQQMTDVFCHPSNQIKSMLQNVFQP